jgi:hypothetical protein
MRWRPQSWRQLRCSLLAVAALLVVPGTGLGAVKFTRVASIPGTGGQVYSFARTSDGVLHLVYPTTDSPQQGISASSISPAGAIGSSVPALSSSWGASIPGLVVLPGGTLEAIFGAVSPFDGNGTIWGIASSDGGVTWSAPVDVRPSPALEQQAYNSPITVRLSGTTPVLTVPQAGGLVIQQGLGVTGSVYQPTIASDGDVTDVDSAVDAATGSVVASWVSLANPGGMFLQGVAPQAGTPELVPGQSRPEVVIAGRDDGPGVFAAYTTDGKHVRLLRYGGGTEAVGSLPSVTPAALGVATGIDGRIWVMWGSDSGNLAVTRSNKAVTRFEPLQHLNAHLITLERLSGDGRLGPLDLFVDEIADTNPTLPVGAYHARVLPVLSASVSVTAIKNKKGKVVSHKLTVTVTDAGDTVSGAIVSVKGHTKKTNVHGVAKVDLAGAGGRVKLAVTAPAYQVLTKNITL